jgi:3-hydroxyisobutyrate dehydrogenase-like beta-hydroxyacid dehydrogenase
VRIAVLGLGEAGRIYASGLVEQGHQVSGYDPFADTAPAGVEFAHDAAAAVRDAPLVLSLVGAGAAAGALDGALPGLAPGTLYADMNTGSPEQKRELEAVAAASGVRLVDVAVMSPVPRRGLLTPLLASGAGAEDLVRILSAMSVPARVVGEEAGGAAAMKLLRSVFMKGLAGVVLEALAAAERTGHEGWLRGEIAGELGPDGEALVDRLVTGTRQHAARREHEMEDVQAYLASIGAQHWMTDGTIEWLRHVAGERSGTPEG